MQSKATSYIAIVILIALCVTGFHYYSITKPCVKPITYQIGEFDTEFGISRESFLSSIVEAESIWEKEAEKELFSYASDGKVKINLIFDKRQQETQEQLSLEATIAKSQDLYEAKRDLYKASEAQYESLSGEYELLLQEYKKAVSEYESSVRYWNRRGGAPEKEYAKLTEQKKTLELQEVSLEEKRLTLNSLIENIQTLLKEVNALAEQTNRYVEEYNGSDLIGTQFDQGLYTREGNNVSVNIYQFTDRTKLVRVLAHELGHVLGLEHNSNGESIMYALNRGIRERLTAEDTAALLEVCNLNS